MVPAVVIVFFKSVSHQPYKTADLPLQICMARMSTEHYVRVWWMILAKITHSKCQNQERSVTI